MERRHPNDRDLAQPIGRGRIGERRGGRGEGTAGTNPDVIQSSNPLAAFFPVAEWRSGSENSGLLSFRQPPRRPGLVLLLGRRRGCIILTIFPQRAVLNTGVHQFCPSKSKRVGAGGWIAG